MHPDGADVNYLLNLRRTRRLQKIPGAVHSRRACGTRIRAIGTVHYRRDTLNSGTNLVWLEKIRPSNFHTQAGQPYRSAWPMRHCPYMPPSFSQQLFDQTTTKKTAGPRHQDRGLAAHG